MEPQMDRSGSQIPSRYVRHRFQADKARSQASYDAVIDGRNGLELSMHIPPDPSMNRFELLRRPSPPLRRYEDNSISPYRCRSRYSRGSKEGKRRRDARRNRRRLAAVQMLDEQLSRDFDRTLRWANVQRPPLQTLSKPASVLPATISPGPQPNRASIAPSGLSDYNFGGLDLTGLSRQCSKSKREPGPPPKSLTLRPQLPSWCPTMPAFLADNTKWNEFPLFFDLSKLPDPPQLPKPSPRCQEVQVWRPKVNPKPERLSRFVPPGTSTKPKVEIPTTPCMLSHPDPGARDAAAQTTEIGGCTLELAALVGGAIPDNGQEEQSDVHPANLWRILKAPQRNDQSDHCDPYIDSFAYEPAKYESDAPYYRGSRSAVCELDDTEIPFVHANSLTGQANERAAFPLVGTEDSVVIYDTRASVPSVQELPFGLNELAVDQYMEEGFADGVLAALDLPPLPPSPNPETTLPALTPAMPATCESADEDNELVDSLAHFKSEEALFERPSPGYKHANDDIVDIFTFLNTTQPLECGCKDCDRPPALINADDATDDDEWMDFLTLTRCRSPSVASA